MTQNVIRNSMIFLVAMISLSLAASAAVDVTSVAITPADPDTDDTLNCQFRVTGTAASYQATVRWRVDGSLLSGDAETLTAQNNTITDTTATGDVEPADTTTGDSWVCEVTAVEGSNTDTLSSSAETIGTSASEKLIISDISAECSPDNCDDDDLSEDGAMDGDAGTVNEVAPGSTLTVRFRVENDWDTDERDHDIENIELTCELEDIEDEDSQEETIDFSDLDPGDRSDREEMQFDIPSDADEDTYSMDCTLEGEDQDGTDYSIDFTLDVDVEKETHSVVFTKAVLDPATVSCDRDMNLELTVQNVGGSDEDGVDMVLRSSALNLARTIFVGDLQEGDKGDDDTEYTSRIDLSVPAGLKAGSYDIQAEVFFDDGDDSTVEIIDFTVQACQPDTPEQPEEPEKPEQPEEEEKDDVVVVQQPYTPTIPGGQTVTSPVDDEPKLDSFTILLAGGVILLLIVLAFMIGMLFRKR